MPAKPLKAKYFALSKYAEVALKKAEYEKDEHGVIIAKVPGASGFFAQGDTLEEARANLQDVVEGNVILALQLDISVEDILNDYLKLSCEDIQAAIAYAAQGVHSSPL